MMTIPDDWKPTAENINALPDPLRRYIHALETDCDPQGTIRQNVLLKQENDMLRKECEGQNEALSDIAQRAEFPEEHTVYELGSIAERALKK